MTHKCSWGECGRDARWQVGFKIWALGRPKTAQNCLRMLSSVTVCDECRPKLKVEDFLLPEGRERIGSALLSLGKAIPDFNSAVLDLQEIIDEPVDVIDFANRVGAIER